MKPVDSSCQRAFSFDRTSTYGDYVRVPGEPTLGGDSVYN